MGVEGYAEGGIRSFVLPAPARECQLNLQSAATRAQPCQGMPASAGALLQGLLQEMGLFAESAPPWRVIIAPGCTSASAPRPSSIVGMASDLGEALGSLQTSDKSAFLGSTTRRPLRDSLARYPASVSRGAATRELGVQEVSQW